MKARVLVTALVAFVLGYSAHFLLPISAPSISKSPGYLDEESIRRHWAAIQAYDQYVRDPENEVVMDGMVTVDNPPDPTPSLAALVAAGEIEHADLVLPEAPNNGESQERWMRFCEEHDDIIYSEGNPTYQAFEPSGMQPLHLQFWYRPSAEPKIRRLIKELESLAKTPRTDA